MEKYRIISNGEKFKVQKRVFLVFWKTVQEPEDLDNKIFGGDKVFTSKKDAQKYIEENAETPWVIS